MFICLVLTSTTLVPMYTYLGGKQNYTCGPYYVCVFLQAWGLGLDDSFLDEVYFWIHLFQPFVSFVGIIRLINSAAVTRGWIKNFDRNFHSTGNHAKRSKMIVQIFVVHVVDEDLSCSGVGSRSCENNACLNVGFENWIVFNWLAPLFILFERASNTKLDNEFWYYSKERRFVVETVFYESVKSIGAERSRRSGAIDGDRAITKMNICCELHHERGRCHWISGKSCRKQS